MKTLIYRHPEPALKTRDFVVTCLGLHEPMQPGIVDRPTGTGDYLLMLFHGPVIIRVSDEVVQQESPSIILWNPKQEHYYGNSDQKWDHSWTHCGGPFIAGSLRKTRFETGVPYAIRSPAIIEQYLIRIYEEFVSYRRPSVEILKNLYDSLFLEVDRAVCPHPESDAIPAKFMELKNRLAQTFAEAHTLESLAAQVHLSVPHFSFLWKKHFGTSPLNHLIRLRLHHAAFLLRNQELSITEIAEQTGHNDIYYFSRLFKKHYGISPRTMRKNLLQQV